MTARDPDGSRASQCYRVLLLAYPRRFRARFETSMRETFAGDHARAARSGLRGLTAFWTITIAEALWYGTAERLSRAHRSSIEARGYARRRSAMRSTLTLDWRDAIRSLRATPVVTAVALLSLALGIGANTALFSLLDGLVLKPLPVRHPEQLILLEDGSWTNPIWEQIRDRQTDLFNGAFAWSTERFNLSTEGVTDFVDGVYASGGMFDVLGVTAHRGRLFTAADDRRDGGADGPVVVVSHRFWLNRLGGTEDAIGRTLTIQGTTFVIVGVTPPGFFGADVGRSADLFVPLGDEALIRGAESFLDGRTTWWLNIMARRKEGQTLEQANARLRGVQDQIREATRPDLPFRDYLGEPLTMSEAAGGRSTLRTRYEQPLTILMVVVGAVLLIACANIANVLLARATARRREIAVRLALGASRARLVRQLLVESLMLAAGGALLGFGFSKIGTAALVNQLTTPNLQVILDTSLDWRVGLFTASVTVATALVFGLAPALSVTRVTPNDAMKEQGRGLTGDRRFGLRNILVIGQVALSLVLVVAAGLFVRTFTSLAAVPLGFDPDPLLVVELNVQQSQTPVDQRPALLDRLQDAAAAVPGIQVAAISRMRPLSGQGWNGPVVLTSSALSERQRMTWLNAVSPGWFEAYGMRLTAGRDFDDRDRAGGPRVAVVNETFARRFLNGTPAVGREVSVGGPRGATSYQVVGTVSDAVYRSMREGVTPQLFMPLAQAPPLGPNATLVVKPRPGAGPGLERSLSDALGRVDRRTSLTFHRFRDLAGTTLTQERLVATLSAFFGGLALLLAALGLYGLTAYSVGRRRREIGVRMALGANPAGVARLVLGRVGWLVAAGTIAGAALSWWAGRYVAPSLLFGLQARDPATFVIAAVVLAVIGAAAGWLPARRAARIDPALVLREE